MGLKIAAEGCKGKERKNTMPGVKPEGEIRSSNKFSAVYGSRIWESLPIPGKVGF
jgi:hypothetical protein